MPPTLIEKTKIRDSSKIKNKVTFDSTIATHIKKDLIRLHYYNKI
jgi:hypothetical protein